LIRRHGLKVQLDGRHCRTNSESVQRGLALVMAEGRQLFPNMTTENLELAKLTKDPARQRLEQAFSDFPKLRERAPAIGTMRWGASNKCGGRGAPP
jgi:ABC-type branched-subunit amino acid transport system ATPase component